LPLSLSHPLVLAGILCLAVLAACVHLWIRRRPGPAERERRRRADVNQAGRMTEGEATDVHDNLILYTYSVNGIEYMASQDISAVRELLPANLPAVIGPVTVKYLLRNPANSIVVCEGWSGVRAVRPEPRFPPASPWGPV
jgi:hypothetical protein